MEYCSKNGIVYALSAGREWYIVTGVDHISMSRANLALNMKIICIASQINGKPVKGIRSEAFKGVKHVECVYIPATVEHIGHQAFAKCEDLLQVVWHGKITQTVELGHLVFLDCPKLLSVTIQARLITGSKDFCNCSSLEKFDCSHIDSIPVDYFVGCKNLKQLSFIECGTLNRSSFAGSSVKEISFQSKAPQLFDGTIEQWRQDCIDIFCKSDNPLVELVYNGLQIHVQE